jgi:isopentenyl diphosphate isomerase/L-lactate dehydrogenase-like FMN-dependent dehydrogenase
VVSNHGGISPAGTPAPLDALASIADAVAGRVPLLIDGSFRRGTDVLKAMILGADAVLLARPAIWGLAAYGDEGVRYVLERIQNELARSSGMLGAATPADLRRDHVRAHQRATT